MAQITIADLSKKLLVAKARWTPRENPISLLEIEKVKAMLNPTEPTITPLPNLASAPQVVAGFAPAVDWRNRNGNHVTNVKNQFSCGSCVSFCTVAVTESMSSIEKGQLLDLSEADQHFCSSHGATCGGWDASSGFNQIKSRGVCNEASFPYATAFPNNDPGYYWTHTAPPNPVCKISPDRNSSVVKISNVINLGHDQTAIKNYLTNTGPVSCSFAVYEDFQSYGTGIYHHVHGVLLGYHCIELIGFSEAEQCWICKNSWGTSWGLSGYIKFAYGECNIDVYDKVGATGVILPAPPHAWYGYENLGGFRVYQYFEHFAGRYIFAHLVSWQFTERSCWRWLFHPVDSPDGEGLSGRDVPAADCRRYCERHSRQNLIFPGFSDTQCPGSFTGAFSLKKTKTAEDTDIY